MDLDCVIRTPKVLRKVSKNFTTQNQKAYALCVLLRFLKIILLISDLSVL